MSTFDSISDALELLVDPRDPPPGDWDDVLRRADAATRQYSKPVSRRRPSTAVVLVLLAATLVATAFATGFADRFSAWVTGSPGSPAPSSAQQAFARLNARAYSSFPQGTKLRLLLSQHAAGKKFELLGFQNGDAYCLRLIRADLPGVIGQTACLRSVELQGNEALVAGTPRWQVGNPAINVTGVFGFVADNVHSLMINRLRSEPSRAQQANNAFLALFAQPSGSVRHHPQANPVTTIVARLNNGREQQIPYLSSGFSSTGRYNVAHPTVPSYFGRPATNASLPGPTKVAYTASSSIGWITKREPLGQPLPTNSGTGRFGAIVGRFGTIDWGRIIQPDPASPIRVGVAEYTLGSGPPGLRSRIGQTWPCLVSFPPLAPRAEGMSCNSESGPHGPITVGATIASPITDFTGLASDAVSQLTVYLQNGRTIDAALTDNVFLVSLPASDLPAKLVAYDIRHRPIAIQTLGSWNSGVLRPCPAATSNRSATAAQPWQKLDLATLEVNGKPILRQTVSDVIAALGKPTRIRHSAEIENGVPIPELLYGGTTSGNAGLKVDFIKYGTKILANSLYYSTAALTDTHLGSILKLQPEAFQHKVQATYGKRYRLPLAYGSNPGAGCTGNFVSSTGPQGFSFGLNPYVSPYRSYVVIQNNAAAGIP
jgi:hypothetical protein